MGSMTTEPDAEAPVTRRRVTLRDAAASVVDRAGATPGTHLWLLVLAITSGVVAVASPQARAYLLHHVSTNLVELRGHPVRVLIASALWIETPSGFAIYFVLFYLVHAPAERWLGTWRWVAVVATAHVGATLISQRAVRFGIHYDRLPRSLAHTVDIGVSYGLAGVVGVLTYRVPRPWRWGYLAAVLAFFAVPVLNGGTFTDLGHLTALLIGLACYALTPDPGPRSPRGRRTDRQHDRADSSGS